MAFVLLRRCRGPKTVVFRTINFERSNICIEFCILILHIDFVAEGGKILINRMFLIKGML